MATFAGWHGSCGVIERDDSFAIGSIEFEPGNESGFNRANASSSRSISFFRS